MIELTDLEGAAMAEIARLGTATSYAVAQSFAQSPSEFWSGSAGAVYPMIKRLAARGLLQADPAATGQRARLDYHLTTEGLAAMEHWLLDARRAAGIGFDPLRTRLTHLDLVTPDQRKAFLSEVRALSHEFATRPVFPGRPIPQKIHASWLKARAVWLRMLEFVL
jgi:DNA-binding PadR family transcriptional regulator